MVLKNKRQGGSLTVHLSGELDHHCARQVRKEIDKLLSDMAVKELILDLRELEFMDSSGIGVLMGRYRTMSKRGGKMRVCNMTSQVRRVFKISGLYRIIEMEA